MDDREPFQRLAEVRERAGYQGPTDAARAFGWNENTYRSHENGERGIRLNVAIKYAAAFKVTAGYILTGEKSERAAYSDEGILAGYVNDDGLLVDYPSHRKDGYEASVVASWVNPLISMMYIEVINARQFLKFSNGDLLMVMMESSSIDWSEGKYAIIELENGSNILRVVRRGAISGTIDIEMSPENPSNAVTPKGIFVVTCIVPRFMWSKKPLSERRAQNEEFQRSMRGQ